MGLFGFIGDAVKSLTSPVLGAVNGIGKMAGGILNSVGLGGIVSQLSGVLGGIPGFGGTFGGLLKMVPDLLNGKIDLEDALKVGALFLPPPASAIASMGNLDQLAGAILGQVGGQSLDPNTPGGQNVLAAAQNAAWSLFG